jgi:hypothetical protein
VDYLRERDGGAPVFHDVNVYPTVVGAWQGDMPTGDRGRWHVFDNCARLGLVPPGDRPVWRQFDDELLRLAARRDVVTGRSVGPWWSGRRLDAGPRAEDPDARRLRRAGTR